MKNTKLLSFLLLIATVWGCKKEVNVLPSPSEVPLASVDSIVTNSGLTVPGSLLWYKHKGYLNGTISWANGGAGIQVGSGWANFKSVFATDSGVIYGIQTDGKLIWYRHKGYLNGTSSFANGGAGIQVGSGWLTSNLFLQPIMVSFMEFRQMVN
jgi:hypothetical protein